MTRILVLDASIAVKWFFADEPQREQALAVLQHLAESPNFFAVPDLFFIGVAAVTVRKSAWNRPFVAEAVQTIRDLGIQTLATGGMFLDRVADVACEFRLSIYDAIYAATAQELEGCWLTADAAAARRLPKALVRDLSTFS